MIIDGREFNFGRCIKIDFYAGDVLKTTVEHAPEKADYLYVAMDVEVTDMPSALANDKPGFMGNITIFNPSKELLTVIASGATWMQNFASTETQKKITRNIQARSREDSKAVVISRKPSVITETSTESAMQNYYASRLQAYVYAGYMGPNKEPQYTRIIRGYVNGSSFIHRGTDDVLKISIYDIDLTGTSPSMLPQTEQQLFLNKNNKNPSTGNVLEAKWYDRAKTRYAHTWDESFKKYVRNFETDWFVPQELKVIYVKSKYAYYSSMTKIGKVDDSVLDKQLEKRLKNQVMNEHDGISGYNLACMLDGLCANADWNVDWDRVDKDVSVNTYLVFPLGGSRTIVSGERADIKIWNYQNLLESPSIDGAGKMTIKMVFNPRCDCNKKIALMLDPNLKETDVTRNVASFESSKTITADQSGMIGSMSSTGNDAAVANNQITGNTNVQSQRKQADTAEKNGYLFNTGFPIIRVEHNLSTYGPNWTTTVKTIPLTGGLRFEGK